jgi:VIT1/CCC1 family predicted Fe2+/Mn2+ transporter
MDYKKQYKEELFDSHVYYELYKVEKDRNMKAYLKKMSEMEKKHSEIWKEIAEKRGIKIETKLSFSDNLKIKAYKLIRRVLGLQLTIKLLEGGEETDIEKYYELSKSYELDEDERRKMRELSVDEAVHEELLNTIRAKDVGDFVYGISDGLVEVLAATSGISGAIQNPLVVAISGLIVGISGMLSMSIGAYLSTKSSKEINESKRRKIELQKLVDREEVSKKLAAILTELGIKGNIATKISPQLVDVAEDIVAPKVEENPKTSALITGISYIVGAIVPILPYFFSLSGLTGLLVSYIISALAIFTVGSIIGLLSEVKPWKKGLEMMGLGISAAVATHLIGVLASHFLTI